MKLESNGKAKTTLTLKLLETIEPIQRENPYKIIVRAQSGGKTQLNHYDLEVSYDSYDPNAWTWYAQEAWNYPDASTSAQEIQYTINERKEIMKNMIKPVARNMFKYGYSNLTADQISNRFEERVNSVMRHAPDFVDAYISFYIEDHGNLPSTDELTRAIRGYFRKYLSVAFAGAWWEAGRVEDWFDFGEDVVDAIPTDSPPGDLIKILIKEKLKLIEKLLRETNYNNFDREVREWVYEEDYGDRYYPPPGIRNSIGGYAAACLTGSYSTAPPWDYPEQDY